MKRSRKNHAKDHDGDAGKPRLAYDRKFHQASLRLLQSVNADPEWPQRRKEAARQRMIQQNQNPVFRDKVKASRDLPRRKAYGDYWKRREPRPF